VKCRYAFESEPGLEPKWVWLKRFTDRSDVTPLPEIHELKDGLYWFEIDFTSIPDDIGGRVSVARQKADGSTYQDYVLTTCYRADDPKDAFEVTTRFIPR
jgi:hypothetical protein